VYFTVVSSLSVCRFLWGFIAGYLIPISCCTLVVVFLGGICLGDHGMESMKDLVLVTVVWRV